MIPFFNDAVAGTVVQVKGNGPARLKALRLVNTTAAAAYLQVFDKMATAVTLGTTAPKFAVRLAANETLVLALLQYIEVGGTGLSLAGTTTPTGLTGAAVSVLASFE